MISKSKTEDDESWMVWEPCVVWTRYSLTRLGTHPRWEAGSYTFIELELDLLAGRVLVPEFSPKLKTN